MKLYRYMSLDEFHKAVDLGLTMVNDTDWHRDRHCKTSSEGFCFLPEDTVFTSYDSYTGEGTVHHFTPKQCYLFLSGIVTAQVLVEFEAPESAVTESGGRYADPINAYDFFASIGVKEYCATSYDCGTFIPLRYAPVERYTRGANVGDWYPVHRHSYPEEVAGPFDEWEDVLV